MNSRVDRDEVFVEYTKSICPVCKIVTDAEINVRDNRLYLRKRCPDHGSFEALLYSRADWYFESMRSTSRARSRSRPKPSSLVAAPLTAGCAPTTSSTPAWASWK